MNTHVRDNELFLYTPPMVRAYNSGNISHTTSGTAQALTFDSERFDTDTMHCVDGETEILTGRGWLKYDEVSDADEALTLNHATGLSEWQPITAMHVYPAAKRTLVSMEGKCHSSLTTPHHQWPVVRDRYRGSPRQRSQERMFAATEELCGQDHIPIAAECADLPRTAKWEDDFVELVAWFWTEGSIQKSHGKPTNLVVLVQSHTRNPANCDRIRAVLYRLFGPAVHSFERQGSRHDYVPRWYERSASRGTTAFTLNAGIGRMLRAIAPEKIVSVAWLRELTRAQIELFIHVSMLADNSGPRSLGQKSREATEAFQVAVLLSGRGSSLRTSAEHETPAGRGRFDGITVPKMWHATLLKNTTFAPGQAIYRGVFSIRPIDYDGPVWCPETTNHTWLARRRGRIYFTGNSTSSNTGRITATSAGKYWVGGNIQFASNAVGFRTADVRVGGSTVVASDVRDAVGTAVTRSPIAGLYVFAAADYAELLANQTSGGALNVEAAGNYSPEFFASWDGN